MAMKSTSLKYTALALALGAAISVFPARADEANIPEPTKGGTSVGLLCTWVAFDSEKETFVLDTVKGAIYWVNQNQVMKVRQFNGGRLVAEGVRNRLKVSPQKFEEKVPVRMVFDRISGDFLVLQDAYKIEASGTCQARRIF